MVNTDLFVPLFADPVGVVLGFLEGGRDRNLLYLVLEKSALVAGEGLCLLGIRYTLGLDRAVEVLCHCGGPGSGSIGSTPVLRVLEVAVKGNDFLESDDVKGKKLDSFGWWEFHSCAEHGAFC